MSVFSWTLDTNCLNPASSVCFALKWSSGASSHCPGGWRWLLHRRVKSTIQVKKLTTFTREYEDAFFTFVSKWWVKIYLDLPNSSLAIGTTPPKLYLGSFLHSNSSFHPYIHSQTANRTRSFDGETSRSASGSCGAIPLPEGGQGVIEQCTKDQNALWTVCNIGCGATAGHLWSTTRDGNRPYRFFWLLVYFHTSGLIRLPLSKWTWNVS